MHTTEPCLWVRDVTYRKQRYPYDYRDHDPETFRCRKDGDVFCRPCRDRFFGEDNDNA